jgi:hypothetical protein
MTTKQATKPNYSGILRAVAKGESASWDFSRAAAREVARGMVKVGQADYDAYVEAMNTAGVPPLAISTLRAYRATGRFWKAADVDTRFGFSVHHFARMGAKDVAAAKAVISKTLARVGSVAGVTPRAIQETTATRKGGKTSSGGRKSSASAKASAAVKSNNPLRVINALRPLVSGLTPTFLADDTIGSDHLLELESILANALSNVRAEITGRNAAVKSGARQSPATVPASPTVIGNGSKGAAKRQGAVGAKRQLSGVRG